MKFVGVDCYCTAVEQGCMIETAKKMYEANIPIDEIIKRLDGIKCGFKPTSCPDQLAKALKKMKEEM